MITDCIKKQAVPAIPNTVEFFDERVNFVRQSMKLALNHVLLVGATEGGNYYASSLRDKTVDNAAIISGYSVWMPYAEDCSQLIDNLKQGKRVARTPWFTSNEEAS